MRLIVASAIAASVAVVPVARGEAQQIRTFPDSSAAIGHAKQDYFAGHPTLSSGLVAYWKLDEPSGVRRDGVGNYHLAPLVDNVPLTAPVSASADGAARFTRTTTSVTDLVVSGVSGATGNLTSASGALPVFLAGDKLHLYNHSVTANNGVFVATGAPTAFLLPVMRLDATPMTNAASEAADIQVPQTFLHGHPALQGFSGNSPGFGRYQDNSVHLDGADGITIALWLKFRTGATTGQVFLYDGVAFAAQVTFSDGNVTNKTAACTFHDQDGSAGTATAQFDTPALDTWYFFVCSYDPVTRKATLNRDDGAQVLTGVAMAASEAGPNYGYGAGYASLGGEVRGFNYSSADLGGVGLWNKVLSAAEITYLYNAGSGRKL